MPNYYEISPTDDTLTLRDGKASASFTVRYVGDRTVEARAQPVALKGAKDDWLEVESPAVREMEPNQTQNFKVSVRAPQGTSPGDYAMRLDMVSVDNTDEEYDQGPPVTFKVEESREPEPESSGFPWWIVAVIAVVLVLAIGGGTWYAMQGNGPGPVTVDDWTGDYQGRLDGRSASLEIRAEDNTLRLIQRDLDRDATTNGEARYQEGDQSHILTGPFGNSEEIMILHRHNTDFISMRGKWRGVSFGRAFSADGFDRPPGRNFDDNRWADFWQGRFDGHTDGLTSRLIAATGDGKVALQLAIDNPDGTTTTYIGMKDMVADSDPNQRHILGEVTLVSEEGAKKLTIKELLIHTWGSNYMTGIAETPDGTQVGQVFVREQDVPPAGRVRIPEIRRELRLQLEQEAPLVDEVPNTPQRLEIN